MPMKRFTLLSFLTSNPLAFLTSNPFYSSGLVHVDLEGPLHCLRLKTKLFISPLILVLSYKGDSKFEIICCILSESTHVCPD